MEFIPFPKIPRLNRDVIVTEKIDGTNAQVCISLVPDVPPRCEQTDLAEALDCWMEDGSVWAMRAGSRKRWITPASDNFGFAKWVKENSQELRKLGPGQHFGEWYGSGIQRGYNMVQGDKRFALFNTSRWSNSAIRPACCQVVPVICMTTMDKLNIPSLLEELRCGSFMVTGFYNPEGIVVFHAASRSMFKVTLENDMHPKSADLNYTNTQETINHG